MLNTKGAEGVARVDVRRIDRTQFKVAEEDGEVLVVPHKSKHHWSRDELHLRSLVLDGDGAVVSAGFPKFFNLGEDPEHDRELAAAMVRGAVELPEKLDGSLVVADRVRGAARLRTRGQRVLGELASEVESFLTSRHPRLEDFLRGDALLDHHSLLFEYVSPVRSVVIRRERADLFLLGYVDKRSLAPGWDAATLAWVTRGTGVPAAPVHPLPEDLDGALAQVRTWKGREGVVARFHTDRGEPRLLKVKTEDYLRAHAYRSRLGNSRALKVAWLLDLREEADVLPAFVRRGLDWEAAEFARAEVAPYLARRRDVAARYASFRVTVGKWAGSRNRAVKRGYVEQVRELCAAGGPYAEDFWFTVATKLFDGDDDGAQLAVDAAGLGEPVPTLRAWRRDPDGEIRATFNAPVREEDG